MAAVAEDKDAYRAGFERFAAAHAASDPAWLRARRTAAMARFVERGLPTARDEAWRHTPTGPLAKGSFLPADPAARPSADSLAALPREGLRGALLVLVNGRLSPELSSLDAGQPGVEVASLREVLRSQPGRLESWLGLRRGRPDRRLRRSQHRLRRGRRGGAPGPRHDPEGADPRRAPLGRGGSRPRSPTPARSWWPGGAASAGSWRASPLPRRAPRSRTPSPRWWSRTTHSWTATSSSRRARPPSTSPPSPCGWGATRASPTTRSPSERRSPATTSTCASTRRAGTARSTASSWSTAAAWPTPTRGSSTRSPTARAGSSTRGSSTARRGASSTASWSSARARRRRTPCR